MRATDLGKNPVAGLPRLTRFLGTDDAGPADPRPNGVCPHCGAAGRYTHWFQTEDGSRIGAMSGCIRLFPVSPVALADMSLSEKEAELARKGWKTNSWQNAMREAIDAFYNGEIDEREAIRRVDFQKAQQAVYYDRKRRARR